ncbi:hypothetical protein COLO4_13177 [Corchorus olitorius]|uniref:Uncharacterized protein n=1 Tax=Corchorus olitorius TaxID=93759 RepID=A0A1R3JXU8_9ROSI|nr:hypothetical protein COLO4_13177 [Corchorus olitorius]
MSFPSSCCPCASADETFVLNFVWEELEQIERMDQASAACKEMLSNVESKPDPLLPM